MYVNVILNLRVKFYTEISGE